MPPLSKGAKNGNWKGDKASVGQIHAWLRYNYGLPGHCDQCGREGYRGPKGRWGINYALIHGMPYTRNKVFYLNLCVSCHRKYDVTDDIRKKISMGVTRAHKRRSPITKRR